MVRRGGRSFQYPSALNGSKLWPSIFFFCVDARKLSGQISGKSPVISILTLTRSNAPFVPPRMGLLDCCSQSRGYESTHTEYLCPRATHYVVRSNPYTVRTTGTRPRPHGDPEPDSVSRTPVSPMSHQHGGLHLRRRALGVTCTAAATIERSKTASSAAVTPRGDRSSVPNLAPLSSYSGGETT